MGRSKHEKTISNDKTLTALFLICFHHVCDTGFEPASRTRDETKTWSNSTPHILVLPFLEAKTLQEHWESQLVVDSLEEEVVAEVLLQHLQSLKLGQLRGNFEVAPKLGQVGALAIGTAAAGSSAPKLQVGFFTFQGAEEKSFGTS